MLKNKLKTVAVLTVVFTTLFVVSCTDENDSNDELNQKLKAFEKTIDLTKNSTSKMVENNNNNYNFEGENLIKLIEDVKLIVWTENEKEKSIVEINETIENRLNLSQYSDIKFNSKEQILFDSFIKNFSISNGVHLCNEYENFSISNFKDQSEIKNFLITISRMKYLSNMLTEQQQADKTYRQWEACTNACMQDRYEDMNIVDWVGHVASGLVGGVAWNYAGCSYGCL